MYANFNNSNYQGQSQAYNNTNAQAGYGYNQNNFSQSQYNPNSNFQSDIYSSQYSVSPQDAYTPRRPEINCGAQQNLSFSNSSGNFNNQGYAGSQYY